VRDAEVVLRGPRALLKRGCTAVPIAASSLSLNAPSCTWILLRAYQKPLRLWNFQKSPTSPTLRKISAASRTVHFRQSGSAWLAYHSFRDLRPGLSALRPPSEAVAVAQVWTSSGLRKAGRSRRNGGRSPRRPAVAARNEPQIGLAHPAFFDMDVDVSRSPPIRCEWWRCLPRAWLSRRHTTCRSPTTPIAALDHVAVGEAENG